MDGEDLLRMKPREIKRLHLIEQALEKKISQQQAAEVAGLSARQMRRLMKRVEAEGDRGIVHRRRGQPSNRRIADTTKQKVLALFEKHYATMGRPWPVRSWKSVIGLGFILKPCGYGCGRRDCLTNSGKAERIGSGASGAVVLERWCRWTDRIMIGWRGEGRSWC